MRMVFQGMTEKLQLKWWLSCRSKEALKTTIKPGCNAIFSLELIIKEPASSQTGRRKAEALSSN